MDYQKACRALKICEAALGGTYTKYFLCFGNILHLIRDKSIEPDKDIDIGVFYDEANEAEIVRGFGAWNYKMAKRIEHDVDHKALYLSLAHESLPPIDIFFWYLHDKIYYHTYDALQENRERPSKYIFKGVEAEFMPDPKTPTKQDSKMIKSFFGPWNKPYFTFEVPVPLYYGSLLDTWYPNWLKPQKMESMSPYVVKLKSCAEWVHVAKESLKESEAEYEAKRSAL